jgi:hypothetical protein
MKKILAMLCLFLLAVPVVFASESEDNTARFEIGQARVEVLASTMVVRMDTVLDLLNEAGANQETIDQLDTIRNEFSELAETVSDFTSRAGLKEGNQELRELVTDFRETAKDSMQTLDLDRSSIKLAVNEAIKNSKEVSDARDNFAEVSHDIILQRYNVHLTKMSKVLDRISEHSSDVDISTLEELLATFESINVEDTLEAGDSEEVKDMVHELKAISDDFKAEVQNLLGDREDREPRFSFHRANRMLKQMDSTVEDLSELGFDVSRLEELSENAGKTFAEAKQAIEQKDIDSVQKLGKEFRQEVKNFLGEVRNLVDDDDVVILALEEEFETL